MALSPEQKERIYNMYLSGMRQAEIGKLFGVHSVTVSKVVSGQRKLHEEGKMAEVVVAGDKRNGRLYSLGQEKFKGECLVGGKMKHRTFSAPNAQRAKVEWEKWRNTLLDEEEFLASIERKPLNAVSTPLGNKVAYKSDEEVASELADRLREHAAEKHADEPKPVCGCPEDPIEEIHSIAEEPDITPAPVPEVYVRPWREVAEERQKRIEELEAELEEAKTQRIEFAEGFQMEAHNPIYVIWAKSENPRMYGAYLTMDEAIKEVDKMNEVASFLGSDDAFEVEEVQWR